MKSVSQQPNYQNKDDAINVKEIFHGLIKNWYWILICGIIGLSLSYFYNRITPATFEVSAKLYAPNENKSIGIENIFQGSGLRDKSNIYNQIEIISSFTLIYNTLKNLNWNVSWYEITTFGQNDLYKYAPYEIETHNPLLNLPGVKVIVTPVNENSCLISVDEKINAGGSEKNIKWETKYNYGDSLRNEFFNFVLYKIPGRSAEPGKTYFFRFNEFESLTNRYQKRTKVSLANEESDIIRINVTVSHPQRGVDFLNELIGVFIDYGLREKNQASENTIEFIDIQLTGIVDSLQSTGQSFTNFRSRNRIMDLGQEAGMVMERLEDIESEETMAKMQLEYYQNLQSYLGDPSRMEQMIAPSVVGITDPVLNSMVVKLSELYSKKNTLSLSVQEKNPSLFALENEIQYTRETLEENLNNLINNAQIKFRSLQERKSEINTQLSRLPKTEQDLINFKRQFDLNNELYTFLLQKRAEAAITKASNMPGVKILEEARRNAAIRIGPNNTFNYLVGLILGFGIPIFIISIFYYLDHTIKEKEDIENETDIPVISSIGHSNKKINLPVMSEPHSGVSESFRTLRTNLSYFKKTDEKQVIAIHSSMSGEGKTFIVSNLAVAIAINNYKVLLINADLRKPKIDQVFKIPHDTIGLSTFLINKSKIEDITINSKIKNLTIIPSGPPPPNPAELLGNGNLEKLIIKAKEFFDYIIIDNSPAGLVTDSIIVGELADINLFVTRSRITNRDQINMINQFHKLGTIKNIAILINDIKTSGYGYTSYYGKGYGVYAEKKHKKGTSSPYDEAITNQH